MGKVPVDRERLTMVVIIERIVAETSSYSVIQLVSSSPQHSILNRLGCYCRYNMPYIHEDW